MFFFFFFFKQKTAYEMCGRDWSSDVCSSDLLWKRRCSIAGRTVSWTCSGDIFDPTQKSLWDIRRSATWRDRKSVV